MNFEEFQHLAHSKLKTYGVELERFLEFCVRFDIHCESYNVLEGREIFKMIVVLIDGKFYGTRATSVINYGCTEFKLYYKEFEEITKETVEREINNVKELYKSIMGIEKLLDENYKNKVELQKTFEGKTND